MGPWAERGLTLLVALAGLGATLLVGLPLPALFGPMPACLLAALLGAPLRARAPAATASRTILGVAVGASVTPAIVADLPAMALSLAVMPAHVALVGLVGVPFFRGACGMDRTTSFFAAMPGGATDMVLLGLEAEGDARALSLTHATRVTVSVALAPILLWAVHGTRLDRPLGESAAPGPRPARGRVSGLRARGPQAEMTVLAIVAGADLGFVVTHRLLRLLVGLTLAPLAARFLR